MLVPALIDIDTPLEAHFSELVLRVIIDVLRVEHQILLPQSAEVHVQLARDEHSCHFMDDGGVHWDLHLEKPQDVVDCVQASDGRDAHEVGHVDQGLGLEHPELTVAGEQVPELK